MPHKVGKKWRWSNIERSSKEDLRKVVYGIWQKNGGKGSFSKFWKTGKVNEDDAFLQNLVFKKVSRDELLSLLDEIETYNENERFDRVQFEKYLSSSKSIDSKEKSMYYGLFSLDGHCLALSYLNKVPDGCVLVAEISCVVHGYGKDLLKDIKKRSRAMWLAANPDGGEKLLEYYRRFGFEEVAIEHSKWANNREEHFFLHASGKLRERILAFIESANEKI